MTASPPGAQPLLILFGSRAKGTARADSDWDVAVASGHQLSLDERVMYVQKAAQLLRVSEDDVDLVDTWSASPLLQHYIGEQGTLLAGDPFLFIRFRVLAWKRYQDTAKLRRLRSEALKHHV